MTTSVAWNVAPRSAKTWFMKRSSFVGSIAIQFLLSGSDLAPALVSESSGSERSVGCSSDAGATCRCAEARSPSEAPRDLVRSLAVYIPGRSPGGRRMTEAHEERRLLAIMFTDVVGFTALTERDEAAAVRVRERHRELVRTLVHQFDGELVDATGDESLSIFPSALRAVDCALALQGALRSHPDVRLRIGVHLGDVLRRGAEVIGEGVNVASRI